MNGEPIALEQYERRYINLDKINKIVLMGGNHHNGLGLVRTLGINGIRPYGIIIGSDSKKGFLHYSKYWEKTWSVTSEQEAIEILKKEFKNEEKKTVVVPWSDDMAEIIDKNLDELSKYFILPTMSNKQGAIAELMDKQKQVEFARTYGFAMLESQILENLEGNESIYIEYPRILKPVTSVEGEKLDIVICDNEEEYKKALEKLKTIGYKRILVQHYLPERKEYVLTGAITNEIKSFSIVSNIRQWPIKMGCGSYSKIEKDDKIIRFANQVLKLLQSQGFNGLIDIEIFEDEDGNFYVNEFNWRSGGRNFVSLYTEVHSVYQYYCSVVGEPVKGKMINQKMGFSMNEATDLRHVVYGQLSLLEWLKCIKNTNNFALWYVKDLKPVFVQYFYLLKKMIYRGIENEL